MPVVSDQVVRPLTAGRQRVSLEPAQALFSDLVLLEKVDELQGVDSWVERTAVAMGEERRQRNHEVINGLYYALRPVKSYPDFPSYLDDLTSQDPQQWIDRLFAAYEAQAVKGTASADPSDRPDIPGLLGDYDRYLQYLSERFAAKYIDPEVERAAHRWLNDPPRMQADAVGHLRTMWTEHLAPGGERSLPLLRDSVEGFRQVESPEGPPLEIARWVIGHEIKEDHAKELEAAEQVVFVPSTHVGPYVISIKDGGALWLVFGARVPAGSEVRSPALSRSQMLVRLRALADENRLHILELLRDEELCAQEIIEALGLSQSSASRHLRQLSSTGYLPERRQESAKCYRLHSQECEAIVDELARFLGAD